MTRYISILLTLILCTSCEKELDFKYHDVESRLVIEGNVSDTGMTVSITQTCPMDEPMDTSPITDARVTVTDLTDNVNYSLSANDDGLFSNASPGITGHQYRLDIDCNGKHFSSTSDMSSPSTIIGLNFDWIKMPYDHVAVLRIDFTQSSGTDDCYWIQLFRNDEPYKWLLSDNRSAVDGVISVAAMTTRRNPDDDNDDRILLDGDIVKVTIAPISRAMYDYLLAIQSDSNGPRMFAGDLCLGYFLASPLSTSSITFTLTTNH